MTGKRVERGAAERVLLPKDRQPWHKCGERSRACEPKSRRSPMHESHVRHLPRHSKKSEVLGVEQRRHDERIGKPASPATRLVEGPQQACPAEHRERPQHRVHAEKSVEEREHRTDGDEERRNRAPRTNDAPTKRVRCRDAHDADERGGDAKQIDARGEREKSVAENVDEGWMEVSSRQKHDDPRERVRGNEERESFIRHRRMMKQSDETSECCAGQDRPEGRLTYRIGKASGLSHHFRLSARSLWRPSPFAEN